MAILVHDLKGKVGYKVKQNVNSSEVENCLLYICILSIILCWGIACTNAGKAMRDAVN